MGIDLIMKYKGKTIADLGRAHNYTEDGEIVTNYDRIEKDNSYLKERMNSQILPIVGYSPKDFEDLNWAVGEVKDELKYFAEEFRKLGRQEVIATLAEEEDITFEKH